MGIILNVRGTSGSGKTEFARRILVSHSQLGYEPEPVVRIGRTKPIAYVLRAKGAAALPPLLVIGHYERGSGGCDTILKADGGMDRVFTLASYYAGEKFNVFLEGNELSRECSRSLELAWRHRFHVLRLATPIEECLRRLSLRRGVPRQHRASIGLKLHEEACAIRQACNLLRVAACVEVVEFDLALLRAWELLGLSQR